MNDNSKITDEVVATMDRPRDMNSDIGVTGLVHAVLTGPDGEIKGECWTKNLVTAAGDRLYAQRGIGVTTTALPTGMRLGSGGGTAAAKTGAGAAIVTYLSGSNKAFDATFPSEAAGVVTYKRTYAAGEATTGSAISEVVINNDTITNDNATTATVANTISRAVLAGIGSKGASDTLTITWTHTILGA